MPIDDCPYSFGDLTKTILPGYMHAMRESMQKPIPLSNFAIEGVGLATHLRQRSVDGDFAGCYVFMEGEANKPIYVGISRGVLGRLIQHVKGKTHFDASLAYRIAVSKKPHTMTRSLAMDDKEFQIIFGSSQEYLRTLAVAFIEIKNPLELYLFEAYCAMELDTSQWNTFRTH